MKNYYRVRIFAVPDGLEETITQHCFLAGATGLTEALQFVQPDLTYDPRLVERSNHILDAFFIEKPQDSFFDELKSIGPNLSFEIHEEEEKDWLAEWKKGFAPFKLVSDYWVVPSWLDAPDEAKHVIRIDPGMAFGTGTHATTQMASYFVHKACLQDPKISEKSLIDVGTGTAILAMLARRHGMGKVIGIDIDAEATRVARENVKQNSLSEIEISDKEIDQIKDKFDYVVANIIDGVLINLKSHLLRLMKPGGQLFVTGILLEREEPFLENFQRESGLKVVRRIEKDEWVGYWFTHA